MNTTLLTTFLLLTVSAAIIYLACEWFVNGIEWIGRKFNMAQTAVGTILAAVGTALPETVVTFVAVVFGEGEAAKDIGIGAALGGPLVLSTLAYALVGWMVLKTKNPIKDNSFDQSHLRRDQGWFLAIFLAKIGLGTFIFAFKPWLGIFFIVAYGIYFLKELKTTESVEYADLEPLKLQPRVQEPATLYAIIQTILALTVIFFASHLFVEQLTVIGPHLGISNQAVALLLSPIATELPEIMNAIIWVRQGKIQLALSNISGSMMIQATVPSALGIFFTPWILSAPLLFAGIITTIAIGYLYFLMRKDTFTYKKLSYLIFLYGVFVAGIIFIERFQ